MKMLQFWANKTKYNMLWNIFGTIESVEGRLEKQKFVK